MTKVEDNGRNEEILITPRTPARTTWVYANADITKAREAIAFCDHWKAVSGSDPLSLSGWLRRDR